MLTGSLRRAQLIGRFTIAANPTNLQQLYSKSPSSSSLPFFRPLQHEPYGDEALGFVS
jgi:hypothetical protein